MRHGLCWLLLVTVAGCGSKSAATHDGAIADAPPASAPQLVVVSGNAQLGVPGATLFAPLVVAAQDATGQPVAGVTIAFTVTAGNGSVSAAAVTTDAQGRAATQLTLGKVAALNTVEASATGVTGSPLALSATGVASTGTFAPEVDVTIPGNGVAVVAADFNGDGRPDLAVTSSAPAVAVLLDTTAAGASPPTFAAHADFTVGANPVGLAAGDLDGDGKPDLVVCDANDDNVSVRLNTTTPGATTPTFAARATFGTATDPRSVVLVDINGDGKLDIVVAAYGAAKVSVLLNTTTTGAAMATFATSVDFSIGTALCSLASADFNGDGRPDLAVVSCDPGVDKVSVVFDTTAVGATVPTLSAAVDVTTGSFPLLVATGDLDGDGRPDLVTADVGGGAAAGFSTMLDTTAPAGTTPSFGAHVEHASITQADGLAVGDLDGDGRLDVVEGTQSGTNVAVELNTSAAAGTATFGSSASYMAGASGQTLAVAIADVNGDGHPDIAAVNNSGALAILLGK